MMFHKNFAWVCDCCLPTSRHFLQMSISMLLHGPHLAHHILDVAPSGHIQFCPKCPFLSMPVGEEKHLPSRNWCGHCFTSCFKLYDRLMCFDSCLLESWHWPILKGTGLWFNSSCNSLWLVLFKSFALLAPGFQ